MTWHEGYTTWQYRDDGQTLIRAREGSIREGNRMQLDVTAGTGWQGRTEVHTRGVRLLRGKFYHGVSLSVTVCSMCRGFHQYAAPVDCV